MNNMDCLKFLFICSLYSSMHFATSAIQGRLQYVQVVFRHGDRSPIRLYPTDPNSESFWDEGLGKLTKLGKLQHYSLGKFLHQHYADFSTTSPNEIDVQSSEVDRCLRSAEVNIASFYSPSSHWEFAKNFPWQPIPVYYVPKDEDKYLETDSFCPRAFEEEERIIKSSEGQSIIKHFKELFGNLTLYSGTNIQDWKSASYLFDTLKIEKKYNLTIPSWVDAYWEQLNFIHDMSFYWSFNSKLMQRLRAGPLISLILDNMKLKASGKNLEKKFHIYSGHDTNVAVILDALNLYNMKAPPYCASLLFELHQFNRSHFVRLLYLNSSAPEFVTEVPHVLIIEGCSEYCPLDFFVNYTKDLIPENWDAECKTKDSFLDSFSLTSVAVAFIFVALAVIVVILSCLTLLKMRSRSRDNYSYHLMSNMPS